MFYITIGFYVLGTIFFVFCASAEPQEWGLHEKEETTNEEDSDKYSDKEKSDSDKRNLSIIIEERNSLSY